MEGWIPATGVLLSGNLIYGTTSEGGRSGAGTVFNVKTDGTDFTIIYNFTAPTITENTNVDGAEPNEVTASFNVLYGTARLGGDSGRGTVFAVNADGTDFKTLHSFTALSTSFPNGNSDGANPRSGLTLSGSTLYGTTYYGGIWGNGTVFKVNTDGTGFSVLYSFTELVPIAPYSNVDGASPTGALVLYGGTLYGTTYFGGNWGNGSVFQVNVDGTSFTSLYSFSALATSAPYGNLDGAFPNAGLIISNDSLYGTASAGGLWNNGTVFKVNTNGAGFSTIHSFSALNTNNANGDGAEPLSGLTLSGSTLYGTAFHGGGAALGTVFRVNTDGTDFATLRSLNGNDGALPETGLILANNSLYGTGSFGGAGLNGTVFSLSLTPELSILWIPSGPHIRLLWSTNAIGYNLQSSPQLFSMTWTNVSPPPVISNGQNAVTKSVLGPQLFYRLSQ